MNDQANILLDVRITNSNRLIIENLNIYSFRDNFEKCI